MPKVAGGGYHGGLRSCRNHVLCGNVQTANATIYVIDQVLKPQNAG